MVAFGMGGTIVGVTLIILAYMSVIRIRGIGWAGLVCLIGGVLVSMNATPRSNHSLRSLGVMLIVLGAIAAIALVCAGISVHKRSDLHLELGRTARERFFIECVLAGYTDFSDKVSLERAKRLIEKYSLPESKDPAELFREGQASCQKALLKLDRKRLEKQAEAEYRKLLELTKYAGLKGRDKRIKMLSDRKAEMERAAVSLDEYNRMLYNSTQEEEISWSIVGGLASGIAGPVAGVAAAANAQIENARIRAENEQRLQAAMPEYMAVHQEAYRNRESAGKLQDEIERTKEKLVDDEPAEELMKKLRFTNTELLVSETGAVTVRTVVSAPKPFYIYKDLPAVIDGTVAAKVYLDGEPIGAAQMVFPVFGAGQDINLEGMCEARAEKPGIFRIEIVPVSLWAMER